MIDTLIVDAIIISRESIYGLPVKKTRTNFDNFISVGLLMLAIYNQLIADALR